MILGNGYIKQDNNLPIVWRFDECIVRGVQTVRFDRTFCSKLGTTYVITQQTKIIPLKVNRTISEIRNNIIELLEYPNADWSNSIDLGKTSLNPNIIDYSEKLSNLFDYYMRCLKVSKSILFNILIKSAEN